MMQFYDVAFGDNVELNGANNRSGVFAEVNGVVHHRPRLKLSSSLFGKIAFREVAENWRISGAQT